MPRRSVKTAPAPAQTPKEPRARQSFGRWAWDWIKSLAAGFALFLVVRAFILQTWVITSGSMEGTLLTGDLLVLNKVAYGAQIPGTESRLPGYTDPKRGHIVVFRAHHDTLDVIKRIVGLPGDTLQMRAKVLYINGQKQTESYIRFSDPESKTDGTNSWFVWQRQYVIGDSAFKSNYVPTRDNWGPFVVPEGHYFLMGDNRDDSLDSRFWGFLDANRVKGKAEVVYFSYERDELKPFAWLREIRWGRIGNRIK
ncbi:MAG: signal peptidase I [Longimicrobiales bacterium]